MPEAREQSLSDMYSKKKEKGISSAKSEYHDKIIQLCQGSFTIIKRRLLDAEGVMAVVCMEMFGRK